MAERARRSILVKLLISIGLFFIGILLARIVFEPRGGSSLSLKSGKVQSDDQRGRLAQSVPDESLSRSLDVLLAALDDGSAQSLQLLRGDLLRGFEEYRAVVLPALKERALENVLSKLTDDELRNWRVRREQPVPKPLQARAYIDDLSVVNNELGAFLDTAVTLLFMMIENTKLGQPFDLEQGGEELFRMGEDSDSAGPSLPLLSRTIVFDSSFVPRFERERGEAVVEFIQKNPADLRKQWSLIFSLNPRYLSASALKEIGNALQALVKRGNSALREDVFIEESRTQVLRQAVVYRPELRRLLAELYIVGTVDALESRDLGRTKRNLHHSLTLQTGLQSQRAVLQFLDKLGFQAENFIVLDKSELVPPESVSSRRNVRRGFPWLSAIVGLAFTAVLVFFGIVVFQRVRDIQLEKSLRSSTPAVFEPANTEPVSGNFMEWRFDDMPTEGSWPGPGDEEQSAREQK